MTWAIFGDKHIQAIGELIVTNSPRVIAVVGGALLDDTLRITLEQRLRDNNDIRKKLFRVSGALGNTGPKIDLLYMLGAFEKPMRNTLYGLAEIRNFFAHHLDASFDSEVTELLTAIKKLKLHTDRKYYPHRIYDGNTKEKIENNKDNQDLFILNLKLCLIFLMRDRASHEPWSNKSLTKKALRERKKEWKELERLDPSAGGRSVTFTTSAAPFPVQPPSEKPKP